jgi:two-component system, NarL family, nitrate/nitrite response regulator NarP
LAGQSIHDGKGRVLIAERNPLVLAALRGLFKEQGDFSITGTVRTSGEVVHAVRRQDFDCLLLGWQLADADAPEILSILSRLEMSPRIVLFADQNLPVIIKETIRFGVHGLCYQFEDPEILFATLAAVIKGRICIPYTELSKVTAPAIARLTARESELLGMLADGWSNTQIATRTGISENTVKYHLKNLYDKLEVRNRAMAVALFTHEKRHQPY